MSAVRAAAIMAMTIAATPIERRTLRRLVGRRDLPDGQSAHARQHRQCGREGVWSWPPDAEAKPATWRTVQAMGARQPGPQGERAISAKTIAQGMPDRSG